MLNLLFLFGNPAEKAFSRYQEHEADRSGLELTHLNDATARMFIRLAQKNYEDPDPPWLAVLWFHSHPPLRERVEYARTHRTGRP